MKKLLTILCLVLLVSCSNEVPSDKLVVRDGITYEVNSTTPFTGKRVGYYDDGQLFMRQNHKDGEQHGLSETFHENGQLETKENYKRQKWDGIQEGFNENGQLEWRLSTKNGEYDGLAEWWHRSDSYSYEYEKKCYKNGEEVNMSYCEE